jgi:hypothetical protein
MSEPDNFLTRWSRRKLETPDAKAPATPKHADDAAAASASSAPAQDRENKPVSAKATAQTPEFDIAKLPSLDSITQATDVRAFLAPGVPPELTRAALRRAWAADPTIRDFRGLQENDWDFTDPNGPMGFGELPPGTDLKKLVAEVFGDAEEPAIDGGTSDQGTSTAEPAQAAPGPQEPASPARLAAASSPDSDGSDQALASPPLERLAVASPAADDLVHRDNIIATHNSNTKVDTDQPEVRRRHGRAVPKY